MTDSVPDNKETAPVSNTKPDDAVAAKDATTQDAALVENGQPNTTTTDVKSATPPDEDDASTEEQEDASASVFSGWGFDVNSVTNNIGLGGFFGSTEGGEETLVDERAELTNDPDSTAEIGAAATNIATAATAELEIASRAAQETIGKAAVEIGRGWGTLNNFLDDMLAPSKGGGDIVDESGDVSDVFKKLFPHLDGDDQIVDHYKCTLLQKYRCYLNNATPEKSIPMPGRLFVTTTNVAMYVSDDNKLFGGKSFTLNVPFEDIVKVQKGAKAMLRIVTKLQSSFIFSDFQSETHFNGAMSLLEQLTAAASASIPVAPPSESADNTETDN